MEVEYKVRVLYSIIFGMNIHIGFYGLKVKREIEEEKLKNALVIATWVGIAVAGASIVATIVEDFVTYGAVVADDAYSVGIAASSYSSTVSSVVRFVFGF